MLFSDIFQELGLVKNEARIYETLLKEGESGASHISVKSQVHRRNVYDTLARLIEKGLVFEIAQKGETLYKAVNPDKLMEMIEEKKSILQKVMPDIQKMYTTNPQEDEVYIYKGIEGWRNYMQDIIDVGEPFYCIGGKGAWLDERLKHFFPQFQKQIQKKKVTAHHLFDYEVKKECPEITKYVGKEYKFFPKGYSAPASIDIFGNHVNIISGIQLGGMDEDFSFTVIVNKDIARAFRIWFRFMYDFCPIDTD